MSQPNRLLKTVVLASSLTLAGGFVLYRAGAFDTLLGAGTGATPASYDDSSAAGVSAAPPDTPTSGVAITQPGDTSHRGSDTSRSRRRTFSGSKSGVLIDGPSPRVRTSVSDTSPRSRRNVFLGGSKSLAPLITPRTSDTPDDRPRRDVFMGGSKSLAPLITPRPSDTPDDNPRRDVFMGGSKSLAPLITPRHRDSNSKEPEDTVRQQRSKR